MITMKLVVDDYCNDCPYFEPETKIIRLNNEVTTLINNYVNVSCKYKDHCRNLYKYMKKENKNE